MSRRRINGAIGGRASALSGVILLVSLVRLNAQIVNVDPAFPPGSGPDNLVRAVARQTDGRILISGWFTNISGIARPRFARLNTAGMLDLSFVPDINSEPLRIFRLNDGRLFVASGFTNVNGQFRPGLARLNADGSLDPAFNPPALKSPSDAYGGGIPTTNAGVWVTGTFTNLASVTMNRMARLLADGTVDPSFQSPFARTNTVTLLAVQLDGKPIVFGNFREVAGTARNGLARLNEDGSLDLSFQPALGPTNIVNRGLLLAGGRLVLSISTTTTNGIPVAPQQLVRLNADGSLDAGFSVQSTAPGFYFNSSLYPVAEQSDGRILVAGTFLRVNGTPRSTLARLNPDGSLDHCFDLGFADFFPLAVAPMPDGSVLVGGSFTAIQGQARNYLARLVPPLACDAGVIEFAVAGVRAGEDAPRAVVSVVRRGGADLEQTVQYATRDASAVVGVDYEAMSGTVHFLPGERSQFIGVPLRRDNQAEGEESFEIVLSQPGGGATLGLRTNVVVTLSDAAPGTAGAPDTNFVVQLDGPVTALLPLADGRVVVGGSFTNVNGQTNPSVARLFTNGARDPAFARNQRLDGTITSLAVQTDGCLLVGGSFRQVDGLWRPGLARFNDDGSLDAGFAAFANWPTNAGYTAEVEQIAVLQDGSVVCGGYFPSGVGQPVLSLVKMTAAGESAGVFPNWNPASSSVGALAPLPNGDLLVGGSGFGNSLVRLGPDGTLRLDYRIPADRQFADYSAKLGLMPDDRVVVAAFPSSFAGLPDLPRAWRANPDGSVDQSFTVPDVLPQLGDFSSVERLSVGTDGRVLVAGGFYSTAGTKLALVRFHADGSWDQSFDQGNGLAGPRANVAPSVYAVAALPQGGWLLAGDFGGYDGFAQPHLVRILPEALTRPLEFHFAVTNVTLSETNVTFTLDVLRRGDASGAASVTVRTQDGTATPGEDFVPLDVTLDFAPGQWSRTVTVSNLNDRIVESVEQFTVLLTNATAGFGIGQPPAVTVRLTSDDAGVEFIADEFRGVEEDGFVLAGVRWSGALSSNLQVTVNVEPDTGSANDLVTTSVVVRRGSLSFTGTNWFRIQVADDAQREGAEQFRLVLHPNDTVVPGPRSNAMLTLNDLDFTTAPARGVAGVIEAIANSPEGGVYLAGDFTGVHGVPRNRVARLLPNGEVDTSFDPSAGPNANVTALAVRPDGKLMIAGDFVSVNGVPRPGMARLDTNGVLDLTFDPGAGPTRTNGIPFVRTLVVEPGGAILVGGAFTHFDGSLRRLLVRLNPGGSLDQTFTPPFTANPFVGDPRLGFPDPTAIHALTVLPNGRILAGGYLYFGPQPILASVVRLAPSGLLDSTFTRISLAGVSPTVWSLAELADGRLLIGATGVSPSGPFGGPMVSTNLAAIRRYHTNGTLDSSFRIVGEPVAGFSSSEVRQILVEPDGRILFVAAVFIRSDLDRAIVGRLLPDGTWDSSFPMLTCELPLVRQLGPFWFNDPENQPQPRTVGAPPPVPTVSLARQPDGILVMGGSFDSVNGEPRRRLARLDPDGDLRGLFQLGVSPGSPPQLFAPAEIEIPYVVQWSTDLESWTPWRTNSIPWQGWSEPVPSGEQHGFFRAVGGQ